MTRRSAVSLLLLAPAVRAQSGLAGTYKGSWGGMTANGDFIFRLIQDGDAWKATVMFTIGGIEVPATVRMLKVEGSTVETKYDFQLGDSKLQSHLIGEVKDGHLTGKYKTKSLADDSSVDEGTCDAKRAE